MQPRAKHPNRSLRIKFSILDDQYPPDAVVESKYMDTKQFLNIDLLIVDDEVDFRDQAYNYFKRVGFQVEQAEDGEEALNLSTNR